jgi:hypothetical protein
MGIAPYGKVQLDESQRLVAANRRAEEAFQLTREATGNHWFETQRSPQWAAALRETLENPGRSVPGPLNGAMPGTSLLTFSGSGGAPACTWIIYHTPAFAPRPAGFHAAT